MPGSTDPRSQAKGRSLFAGMSDRELAVPLIVLVVAVELGWVVLTWPQSPSGDVLFDALVLFAWAIMYALPIAIGALVAAVAVAGLARGRRWGHPAGLLWATVGTLYAAWLGLAMLFTRGEPSGSEALGRRTAPIVFGIAAVASIAVFILLVRDRRALGRPSPPHEASPQVTIGEELSRPKQAWPSSRRSPRRRRRPPPTAGNGGPA